MILTASSIAELRFAVQLGAERLAVDERHHVVEEAVGGAGVEERQDVRVLQRGGGLDFHHEPLGADDGGQLRLQDLERHLAVVLEVLGQVHGGHAALAELPLDQIAISEGGDEAGERFGHRTPRV